MRIPFKVETFLNKIIKTQIVTIVETFIDDKLQKKFYGKSLTGNFLNAIYSHFNDNNANFLVPGAPWNGSRQIGINLAGAPIGWTEPVMNLDAGVADLTQGIVVGSGSTAPAPGDVNLQTTITNGVGAGQLSYSIQTSTQGTTISGSNTSFILQRLMTNGSGGNVTVNEIGLIFSAGGQSFLIYRDVLGSSDVIPNGSTYRVNITFQITT